MAATNILFLHADQHRFDCVGANGHLLISTPHLDRMAREGANFSHAFTPSPVCVPARNSLLYGCWPTRHHAVVNHDTEAPPAARAELPTWSEALNRAGYFLGYVGKWHVSETKSPCDFGFHEYVPETGYNAWRQAQSMPLLQRTNGWQGETDGHITPGQSRLAWGANETIRLIEGASSSHADRPFFIRWDPGEPHLPNLVPPRSPRSTRPATLRRGPRFPTRLPASRTFKNGCGKPGALPTGRGRIGRPLLHVIWARSACWTRRLAGFSIPWID